MDNDKVTKALNERFLLQKEYLGDAKSVNLIQPLVSVTVATYQHANYIKECLDGILMQKVTFPYEIILGEDGSVDGTQEICKEYAEKHPDKIRLFIRDRKLSQYVGENGKVTRFNGIWNRMSARGKYIAWCEGDDYWIDPLKLQKQVDFLENHKDYGLVCTDFDLISEGVHEYRLNNSWVKNDNEVLEAILLAKCDIGTLTVLYRKSIYDNLPHLYRGQGFLMGDLPLWIEFAFTSKIKYLKMRTACYRRLNNSASHSTDFHKRKIFLESIIACRLFYIEKLGLEYLKKDVEILKKYLLLKMSSLEGQKEEVFPYFLSFLREKPQRNRLKAVYYLLLAYFPFLNRVFLILKKL